MEIIFYKSKQYPGYYLIFKGANGVNVQKMFEKLTNTGKFENSGFKKIELEMGFILKTGAPESFMDYLTDKIATNHITHPDYDSQNFRAWYEFKNVANADKWVKEYYSYQAENKKNPSAIQTILF